MQVSHFLLPLINNYLFLTYIANTYSMTSMYLTSSTITSAFWTVMLPQVPPFPITHINNYLFSTSYIPHTYSETSLYISYLLILTSAWAPATLPQVPPFPVALLFTLDFLLCCSCIFRGVTVSYPLIPHCLSSCHPATGSSLPFGTRKPKERKGAPQQGVVSINNIISSTLFASRSLPFLVPSLPGRAPSGVTLHASSSRRLRKCRH